MERWSGRLDLVSPRDLPRFASRHVADSLRLLELERSLPGGDAVDVGSGAGLPAIPLAIASPGRLWRLIERRRGRAAFLEETVRILELRCEVVAADAREVGSRGRLAMAHVLATARALAPPGQAFELLLPFLRPGGTAAVFVSRRAQLPEQARLWADGVAIIRRQGAGGQANGGSHLLETPGTE